MPELDYAFLADAADARPGQKFSVLGGGITRIGGPGFPLHHPHLALVIGLTIGSVELGRSHEIQFTLQAPDGSELSRAQAGIQADGPAGGEAQLTFAVDLWNLTFPTQGDYSIRVFVNGSERRRLTLGVYRGEGGQVGSGVVPPFPPPTGRA